MGPEYKPDNSQNAQNVAIVSRCKSPEQIRVPRFTDLPLAGALSATSHDVNIGGTIMMASMGSGVPGVTSASTVGAPIAAGEQSSQQNPTSLLTMSSAPVVSNKRVCLRRHNCHKTMGPYAQYVITQPQQHIPFSMTVGANQSIVPFIDTTRPPPAVSSITGHVNPSQVAVPLPSVGRGYYNPTNVIPVRVIINYVTVYLSNSNSKPVCNMYLQ
ncbi:hypothetical protein KIN20_002427 [Parelaphostrongylus tenuis]|uniref:Uncharacterized protein n=1 Tax=Parelaphostrongylus tenuis TaxID=148309 RepID=A0AAD5LZT1_PARTN|nr:hypothetical protein KIN20_002427 [Parelaphostrongylus tenuis]